MNLHRLIFAALFLLPSLFLRADSTPPAPKLIPPTPIEQFAPRFPFAAKKDGVSGTAVVEFAVGKNGKVSDVVVVQATRKDFGDSAVECISKWKFRPGKVDGRVSVFKIRQTFPFDLGNSQANKPLQGTEGKVPSSSTEPEALRP